MSFFNSIRFGNEIDECKYIYKRCEKMIDEIESLDERASNLSEISSTCRKAIKLYDKCKMEAKKIENIII